ncbi:MAG TPA: P-type DNA transfer ATPase VirB11 [Steroidobacteraceae bacterium]|nr:P-type DNA transfer ATPase VirB11 [Steroidobacteraceae bacterium]
MSFGSPLLPIEARSGVAVPETPRALSPCSGSALDLTLEALRPLLADPEVTELCINRPREVFLETRSGWRSVAAPFADFDWCQRLAKLIANATRQRVDESAPLLSASLPTGERVQIVLPPATTLGCVAITIRRPSAEVWSLEELARRGALRAVRPGLRLLDDGEAELKRLHAHGEYLGFLRLAVRSRRNIVVSGPTGSGKTTWTKALIQEVPVEERLVTIEDARELVLDRHPNHVRLYYSKDDQGLARVTPKQLLECCLRMRPDRILLAELRAEEAFDYLRNVNSGHPGSITSVHAASAELAFEQLVLLVKQSPGGRTLDRDDIKQLLYLLIDVVIQCGLDHHRRVIREIWYQPERRSADSRVEPDTSLSSSEPT